MTTENLIPILCDCDIKRAIHEIAYSFTKSYRVAEELKITAWITIAEMNEYYTTEYYIGRAYAVMRHRYEIYYMVEPDRRATDDPGNKRAKRKIRKYL